MKMTTWRKLIADEMGSNKDSWEKVQSMTLQEADLDVTFSDGYGIENGKPFCLWTSDYVYFPACYDGSEWCASVPRHPCNDAVAHVGG